METTNNPQGPKIEEYLEVMPEYMHHGDPEKFKFIDRHFGWKIHLNALPNNVLKISEFLKDRGYTHKYLKTGNNETSTGKIFTVYFGPKEFTETCIKDVSDGIGDFLIPPLEDHSEQLVAPNIMARFDTDPNSKRFNPHFTKHGYAEGIPLLNYYNEDDLEEAIKQSSRLLTKEFGDFFGGSLETYKL